MKIISYFVLCFPLLAFSHIQPGFRPIYTYPLNKAVLVHPRTDIGIGYGEAIDPLSLSSDSVTCFSGEKTISGTVKLSRNAKFVIFHPDQMLPLGATLTFHIGSIRSISGKHSQPLTIKFTTRNKIVSPGEDVHSDDPLTERELRRGQNADVFLAPDSVPAFTLYTDNDPSPGNIAIGFSFGAILDKDGRVISSLDDKKSTYVDLKPYPNGTYSYYDITGGSYMITDTNFQIIDTVAATGAYSPDEHEIRRTSDGDYIILGNDYVTIDMRQYVPTGDSQAVIIDPAVLKYDQDDNLIWEWRAIDHFSITDATYENMEQPSIDFCHINAIEFDADSNYLLSCRNMDEVTKIDNISGNIIWRWGGRHNQFTLAGDNLWFSHQHAVRRTDAGTYVMMDNGNFHSPPFSRAVEYSLDTLTMTATKIWEFRHSPDIYTTIMGSVERLSNKGTLICWGSGAIQQQPGKIYSITEVDSLNTIQFELGIPAVSGTYRAFKFDSKYLHQEDRAAVTDMAASGFSLGCYPNPVAGKATILCSLPSARYLSLSLYDRLGREISKIYSGNCPEGNSRMEFDPKDLASGIYFLRCNVGTEISTEKIVIAR